MLCDDVRALLSGEIVCWRNAKRHGGIRHCAAAICLMPLIVLLIVVEVLVGCIFSFMGILPFVWADFFAGLVWLGTCCFCGDPKRPMSPCEYQSMEVKMGQLHLGDGGSIGGYIAREEGPWEVIPGCECSTLCCEHVVQPPPQAPPPPVEGHTTTGATGTIASLRQVVVHPVAAPLPLPSAPPHECMVEGQTRTER
jgi:hypothetical protein